MSNIFWKVQLLQLQCSLVGQISVTDPASQKSFNQCHLSEGPVYCSSSNWIGKQNIEKLDGAECGGS